MVCGRDAPEILYNRLSYVKVESQQGIGGFKLFPLRQVAAGRSREGELGLRGPARRKVQKFTGRPMRKFAQFAIYVPVIIAIFPIFNLITTQNSSNIVLSL
jgi:hypothetical protein